MSSADDPPEGAVTPVAAARDYYLEAERDAT